jgi:hypothetical protein
MSVDDRFLKFREAIWVFTDKILPKIDPVLQPSLADIAWLMANHFFAPEDSKKLYLKIREIWRNRSLEPNYQIELLSLGAWKIRLLLTFNQQESAFKLFQYITKAVRYKKEELEAELEAVCLPSSDNFPLPKISEADIEFLFGIGRTCQQTQGNLTISHIAKQINLTKENVISYLQKLEMVFGCMISLNALDLFWIRAEIDIKSHQSYAQLIERFKPIAHRCEAHSSLLKSNKTTEFQPTRFSIEFLYPIKLKNTLKKWAIKNGVCIYYLTKQQLYQNFNILYNDPWNPQDVNQLKSKGFITIMENSSNILELSRPILQIIETYLKPVAFYEGRETEVVDCLLPFYKLGSHLKLQAEKAHQLAVKLFQQRILVPYVYSDLFFFTPEIILEGNEFLLHDEARRYLYARAEGLQSLLAEEKEDLFRLYVSTVSTKLLKQYKCRIVKRLYWEPPAPIIQADMYDFDHSCWKYHELPQIYDLL